MEKIKTNFLAQAKLYHPDSISFAEIPAIRQLADEIFTMVSTANEVLTNEKKRAKYVEYLADGGAEDATEEVAKILVGEQHFHSAQAAVRRKDWVEAKRSIQEAIKLAPNEAEFYSELGWAHFNLNPRDMVARQEAISYVEKAIEMNSKLANAYFYLGSIHKATGNTRQAAEYFIETLRTDRKHVRAKSEVRLLRMRKDEKLKSKKGGILGFLKKD